MSSVRRTALDILIKIEKKNAYAAPLLARAVPELQNRDRRLLVELVYGVLRWRLTLDWLIAQTSRVPIAKIDPPILNILRLGAFQAVFLSRIPRHASVFTSVEMAKSMKGKKAGGFVNAIMRRIGETGKSALERLPGDNTPDALAVRTSHPPWLIERWMNQFGYEETEALCQADNLPPPATLRVNIHKIKRETLMERAKQDPALLDAKVVATTIASNGLTITPLSAIFETDWLEKGFVTIQDEASQLVGEIVSPRQGERILDACSGIGVKAMQLMEISGSKTNVLCMDLIPWKLKQLRSSAKRLRFPPPPCVTATTELPPLANQLIFDKVLLDAPCSNTGVIRRHPERKWRLTEGDIERATRIQERLLEATAQRVKVGGALIYSTCSLEREEGEEMIERFLRTHEAFDLDDCARVLGKNAATVITNGVLRSFPHKGGMDGFFCARLIRRRS